MELLLAVPGVDLTPEDRWATTPLTCARRARGSGRARGNAAEHAQVLALLEQAGAQPIRYQPIRMRFGVIKMTALTRACSVGDAPLADRLLVQARATGGLRHVVEQLGAIDSWRGSSLLHWASFAGCVECMAVVLRWAGLCGLPVHPLINAQNELKHGGDRSTPLSLAARYVNADAVDFLLRQRADPLRRNINGNTPLHEACKHGAAETVAKLLRHQERDRQLRTRNTRKQTSPPLPGPHFSPLMVAIEAGKTETVALLLRNGAPFDDWDTASASLELRTGALSSLPPHAAGRRGSVVLDEGTATAQARSLRRQMLSLIVNIDNAHMADEADAYPGDLLVQLAIEKKHLRVLCELLRFGCREYGAAPGAWRDGVLATAELEWVLMGWGDAESGRVADMTVERQVELLCWLLLSCHERMPPSQLAVQMAWLCFDEARRTVDDPERARALSVLSVLLELISLGFIETIRVYAEEQASSNLLRPSTLPKATGSSRTAGLRDGPSEALRAPSTLRRVASRMLAARSRDAEADGGANGEGGEAEGTQPPPSAGRIRWRQAKADVREAARRERAQLARQSLEQEEPQDGAGPADRPALSSSWALLRGVAAFLRLQSGLQAGLRHAESGGVARRDTDPGADASFKGPTLHLRVPQRFRSASSDPRRSSSSAADEQSAEDEALMAERDLEERRKQQALQQAGSKWMNAIETPFAARGSLGSLYNQMLEVSTCTCPWHAHAHTACPASRGPWWTGM